MRSIFAILSALSALAASTASAQACPPEGYGAKSVFNPDKYFDGRWYTLKQIAVAFQPEVNLFCVTGNYKIELTDECKISGCTDTLVRVTNGASPGVTGARNTTSLVGVIKDPTKPAEVSVGPAILPPSRYGPYWVVDTGSYEELLSGANQFTSENYEWSIVTGGAPVVQTAGGCLPGQGAANSRGFWLLSREPVVPQEITEKLVALAQSKGLDVTALKTVPQEGCTYL